MELSSITPTPAALRALAHPVRLRMLMMLRLQGPATATRLARELDLNTGATSYHLRQLARHGFVEEDTERGNARDRWWRAVHQSTRTDADSYTEPGEQDTFDAYLQAVAVVHTQRLQQAVEERALLSPAWRKASSYSDWALRLTPERAAELVAALAAVVAGWEEDAGAGPATGEFVVQLVAFPEPGTTPATTAGDRQ